VLCLKNKKVFITGAGSGLGMEAAIELARRGHTVYASTHYENEVEKLKELAKKENLNLVSFKLDILEERDREQIKNYDIDVFIANSAIGDSGSVAEIEIQRIEKVFNTNIFANLKTIQIALQNMIEKHNKGRIIFISSLVGRIPMPFLSPYCASKFAIEGFATCLRKELKKLPEAKIEVGIIEPGAYATGFNKENNEKKYMWMYDKSYFKGVVNNLRTEEEKVWNFLEIKPFNSIINKYVKAVEDKHLKHRYTAVWWQALGIQLARIFGK